MMSALALYKAALRDTIGPALRSEGFRGSGTAWRMSAPTGDVAVVSAQSSSISSDAEVLFIINLAVIPRPWLEFRLDGRPVPKAPSASYGLWHDRLHPTTASRRRGSEPWWSIHDETSAAAASLDAVEQLKDRAAPLLRRLLDREHLIATLRRADLGFGSPRSNRELADMALAVLLTEEGSTDEVDQLLSTLAVDPDAPTRPTIDRLHRWVDDHR